MKLHLICITLFIGLFLCTPSIAQTPLSIADARQVDADGSLVNLGATVELQGLSIGPNYRPGGHTWVLFDTASNIGITVFGFSNDTGYDVADGDQLRIVGELDEFNGLAEIIPETIEVISVGNSIPDPETVVELSEQTEAKLIRIENVTLADPSQWGSSNFNVDITDGTNTFQMRIDGDIDISGMAAPQGTFNVVGVGGQFDGSAPYFSGYQIFPRSASDIDPYDTGGSTGVEYEKLSISDAREIDLNGNAVRLGENVEIQGIVHGMNIRPSGLQFALIDGSNIGLWVFSSSNPFDYEYMEGDELVLKGSIGQFNGLTQINPDSLFLVSRGNPSVTPTNILEMNESFEGSLVTLQMVGWENEADWAGDGSSFNIDFITLNGFIQTMRIDNDTELATAMLPTQNNILIEVTGIVGQFDSSEPYDEGYQLFPFRVSDFDLISSIVDPTLNDLDIFPNPVQNRITIRSPYSVRNLALYNVQGSLVKKQFSNSKNMDVNDLPSGTYVLLIECEEGLISKRVYKK